MIGQGCGERISLHRAEAIVQSAAPALRTDKTPGQVADLAGLGLHGIEVGVQSLTLIQPRLLTPMTGQHGTLLADLKVQSCGSENGGTPLAAHGGIVVVEPGNNREGDWKAFELTAKGRDAVDAKELWTEKRGNGRECTITLADRFIKANVMGGYAYEPRSGQPLWKMEKMYADQKIGLRERGEIHGTSILVGDRILLTNGGGNGYGRDGIDGQTLVIYRIASLDGKCDPKEVSVLGGANKPRYPLIEKYLPEIYQEGDLDHEVMPASFSHAQSGPVAQGKRLYLRSTSHLYCIGPK